MRTCNELNSDTWMNLPCTADNDYVEQFGNLMLYGSDPAGKVYTAAGGSIPAGQSAGRRLSAAEEGGAALLGRVRKRSVELGL